MVYEYVCEDCEFEFEKNVKLKNFDTEFECPKCKSKNTKRVVSKVSKGYILGYNAKNGYSKKQKTHL